MRQALTLVALAALLPIIAACDDHAPDGPAANTGNTDTADASTDAATTDGASGDAGAADATATGSEADPAVVDDAAKVQPIGVGDRIPEVTVRSTQGEPIALRQYVADKPTILVFYRGGWCPFCTKHLAALGESYGQLMEMGYQLLAISPDTPANAAETVTKYEAPFLLASDSGIEATRAFGLAFEVDAETRKKYHEYGIDLEKASGQAHHVLPVPAIYIVDTQGVVRYRHYDPDYKQRLDPAKLISSAKATLQSN